MRLTAALVVIALLPLAGCFHGVTSTADLSHALKAVTPFKEGTYAVVPSKSGGHLLIERDGNGYRMSNPASQDPPLPFRVLSMPELPATRFLVQVPDHDKKTGKTSYHYYFTIMAGDQILVLSPSKYALESGHLDDALKPLIEVQSIDEIHVPDAANTLAVLRRIIAKDIDLELVMQLVRQP